MQKTTRLLCATAVAAVLGLTGCVTQPTTSAAPTAPATTQPGTAATLGGAVLSSVLANGGAAGVMSSLGVPASASAGNAAGVLTYCAKNNLLNASNAQQLTQQLLGQLGVTPQAAQQQDTGYQNGMLGMIVGPNGQLYNLDQIKGNAKNKACDFVLNQAQNFLPK